MSQHKISSVLPFDIQHGSGSSRPEAPISDLTDAKAAELARLGIMLSTDDMHCRRLPKTPKFRPWKGILAFAIAFAYLFGILAL